jgi:hypothetical protein
VLKLNEGNEKRIAKVMLTCRAHKVVLCKNALIPPLGRKAFLFAPRSGVLFQGGEDILPDGSLQTEEKSMSCAGGVSSPA